MERQSGHSVLCESIEKGGRDNHEASEYEATLLLMGLELVYGCWFGIFGFSASRMSEVGGIGGGTLKEEGLE